MVLYLLRYKGGTLCIRYGQLILTVCFLTSIFAFPCLDRYYGEKPYYGKKCLIISQDTELQSFADEISINGKVATGKLI